MLYYDDIENVKNYIDMAKESDASALIDKFSMYVGGKSTVLEIGMGPGNDLKLLNKKFIVTGSDKFEKFIDEYKKTNIDSDLIVLDAATLETSRKFDAIYSNKVLMHLTKDELKKSILRQDKILNEKGIVFHTFWKGEGEENFGGMLNIFYKEDELRNIFETKFEIIAIENYLEFEKDDSIILIAKKV
ncbi:MAG: class I SAM-dependent methyltransferase [Acidaminobacteraceae bacterium]